MYENQVSGGCKDYTAQHSFHRAKHVDARKQSNQDMYSAAPGRACCGATHLTTALIATLAHEHGTTNATATQVGTIASALPMRCWCVAVAGAVTVPNTQPGAAPALALLALPRGPVMARAVGGRLVTAFTTGENGLWVW